MKILGCQSQNHEDCKGELWKCAKCDKITCEEEGSDDKSTLCDDCWNEATKKYRVFLEDWTIYEVAVEAESEEEAEERAMELWENEEVDFRDSGVWVNEVQEIKGE